MGYEARCEPPEYSRLAAEAREIYVQHEDAGPAMARARALRHVVEHCPVTPEPDTVLLGGEGTVGGGPSGNRYDISMESGPGALANMVVLVTGSSPVVVGAKIPACGETPVGRWCEEVELASPVVINGD
jgi:hypothetical protein